MGDCTELLAIMQTVLSGTRNPPHPTSLPTPPNPPAPTPGYVANSNYFFIHQMLPLRTKFSVYWNERQAWTTVFHLSPKSMKRLTINLFWRAHPLTCRIKVSSGFLLLNHNSNLSPLSPTFSVRPKSVVWIKDNNTFWRSKTANNLYQFFLNEKHVEKLLYHLPGQN